MGINQKKAIKKLIQKRKVKKAKKTSLPKRPKYKTAKYEREILAFTKKYLLKVRKEALLVQSIEELKQIENDIFKKINEEIPSLSKAAATQFKAVNVSHKVYFEQLVKKSLGINIKSILKDEGIEKKINSRVNENIKLITNIPKDHFKKTRKIIHKAIKGEINQKKLIKHLRENEKMPLWRSKLIARDQTSKMYSELDHTRQTNIGISRYEWVSSGDSRVRESHKARDGEIFKWNDPPSDGHPGEPIGCRCVAYPVFEDIL